MESVTELVFFFPCTLMGTVLHVMEPGVKVRENKGSCWPQTLQKADVVKQHDLERIQEPDRGWVLCTLMCPGLLFWFFVFCACKQLCSRFLETGVCAHTVYKIILTFKYKYIVFQPNKYTVTHQGNYPRPQVDSCVCWSSLALSLFCSLSLLQSELVFQSFDSVTAGFYFATSKMTNDPDDSGGKNLFHRNWINQTSLL